MRTLRTAAVALTAMLWVFPSFAQSPKQAIDPKVMYEEAVASMDKGDYATACPKLEKVTQLVPEGLGGEVHAGGML